MADYYPLLRKNKGRPELLNKSKNPLNFNPKTRILYLTPGVFDKGGISRYGRYQIESLRKLYGSKSVKVLSLLGPSNNDFESSLFVDWHGGTLSRLTKIRFVLFSIYLAVTWRPKVVHCAHVNLSALAVILSLLSKSQSILNVYGLEVWSGLQFDAKWGLRKCQNVISDCHFTAKYIEDEGMRRKGSTQVIWDCVDTKRFFPSDPNLDRLKKYGIYSTHAFTILTLGRISREASHKGYDRLLKVLAEALQQNNELRLIIAGCGNMLDDLKREASELGIDHAVIFTGSVDEDDLPDLYRCSQIFSLVSDRGPGRGEGIPLTPLEAMSCGIPIIVGNHDGSQEAVVNNRNGHTIDPFDLKTHKKLLLDHSQDLALNTIMGQEATRVAQSLFCFDEFTEKHRLLYRHILTNYKTEEI